MKIHRFNDAGVTRFRAYLSDLRQTPTFPPPWDLLEDSSLTMTLPEGIDVERPSFTTKRDAAVYLHEKLKPLLRTELFKDVGLWTWLSLFYFDDVCPESGGKRKPANDAHYVLEAQQVLRYYKHLLATSVRIYDMSPVHHRVLLLSPLAVLGQVMERMAARLYLLRIPCVPEVLDRLYFDEDKLKPKRGAARSSSNPRAGDLSNRFPVRMKQLQRTYDANALSADQLIALLGREFSPWQSAPQLDFASSTP